MIHESAFVEKNVKIGDNTNIWHLTQVRDGTIIGKNCVLGKNVFIDKDTIIGNNCKIQNNVSIYYKTELEDGVFIGPHVCFTNDMVPRAINKDESLKSAYNWKPLKILIKKGAAVGANSTLIPGITINEWAMVGAGAIVTKDVSKHALVVGCPAKIVGYVCYCGNRLDENNFCKECDEKIDLK